MYSITVLRRRRRRGYYLSKDDKARLCQDDIRRMKRLREWAYRIAWVLIIVAVFMAIRVGGYMIRGYSAWGSELFAPWIMMFLWWVYQEDKIERKR